MIKFKIMENKRLNIYIIDAYLKCAIVLDFKLFQHIYMQIAECESAEFLYPYNKKLMIRHGEK